MWLFSWLCAVPAKRSTAGKTRSGRRSSSLTPGEQKRKAGYDCSSATCPNRSVALALGVSWVTFNGWFKQLGATVAWKGGMRRVGSPNKLGSRQLATPQAHFWRKVHYRHGLPKRIVDSETCWRCHWESSASYTALLTCGECWEAWVLFSPDISPINSCLVLPKSGFYQFVLRRFHSEKLNNFIGAISSRQEIDRFKEWNLAV